MGAFLIRRFCVALSLALFSSMPQAIASPWGQKQGELFVLTRSDYFRAEGRFLASTPTDERDLFERIESNTYAEYGLTRRVTVGGKVIYGASQATGARDAVRADGLSEIEAFAQYQLLKRGAWRAGVRTTLGRPSRFDTGARAEIVSDSFDVETRAMAGRSFKLAGMDSYVIAEAAYRARLGAPADQARADFLVGIKPTADLLFILQSLNSISLRNETGGGGDFDVYRVQPSMVWRIRRRFAAQIGLIHEYAGRNFARGDTYFVGFWTGF